MSNYTWEVNGTIVTRTWSDGVVETFDVKKDYPENIRDYFLTLGFKERYGSGGILAGKTGEKIAKQREICATMDKDYKKGILETATVNYPSMEQLRKALAIVAPKAPPMAIEARLREVHPDATTDMEERATRRKDLRDATKTENKLTKALRKVGFEPARSTKKEAKIIGDL